MSDTITVGKSRFYTVSVPMSNGTSDGTTTLGINNPGSTFLKIRVNPSNRREVGVLALAAGFSSTFDLTCGTASTSVAVQTIAAPAPTQVAVNVGPASEEIDPPAWLTA